MVLCLWRRTLSNWYSETSILWTPFVLALWSDLQFIGSVFSFLISYWLSWIGGIVLIIMFSSLAVFLSISMWDSSVFILIIPQWIHSFAYTQYFSLLTVITIIIIIIIIVPHFYKRFFFCFYFCGLKKKTNFFLDNYDQVYFAKLFSLLPALTLSFWVPFITCFGLCFSILVVYEYFRVR